MDREVGDDIRAELNAQRLPRNVEHEPPLRDLLADLLDKVRGGDPGWEADAAVIRRALDATERARARSRRKNRSASVRRGTRTPGRDQYRTHWTQQVIGIDGDLPIVRCPKR